MRNILTLTSVEFNFFMNLASCNDKEGITLSKTGKKNSRNNFDPYGSNEEYKVGSKWWISCISICWEGHSKRIHLSSAISEFEEFLNTGKKRRGGPCPLGFEKVLVTLQHPAMLVQGK